MLSRLLRWGKVAALLIAFAVPGFAQAQTTGPVPVQTTANANTVQLSIPIGGTTAVSGLPEYLGTVYRYSLGIVTLVAIIMVVYGGFRYLLGATTGDVKTGKTVITDAIGGMAILFLAYVILYTINPKTVRLSLPDITRIQTTAINSQANAPGTTCAKDGDCSSGAFCLRTSLVSGLCANGQPGNICRCRGAGCGVTSSDAGGPTNNSGQGTVACQTGSTCQEISADNFVCNGGAVGSACNETSETVRSVDATALAGDALHRAEQVALALTPFSPLTQGGEDVYRSRTRAAIRCTQAGQFCFQTDAAYAGACVYGDPRDITMFEGIPEYRTNTGLQAAVQRCDLTEAQLRTLPKANGGCRNVSNTGVDEFCIQHRYRCANDAVCARSTYADLFAGTLRAYYSWENVPQQLRQETYFKQGCFKTVGATCTSDSECPSKCLQGRCSGFGALKVRDSVTPGSLRGLPTASQLDYAYTVGAGCPATSWTAIDLLEQARGSTEADQQTALNVLFAAGTTDRFACYPARPAGAKCDLNAQCISRTCSFGTGTTPTITIPTTFSHPLDNTVGAGTCT